jgi:hypothetical protein
MELEQAGWFSSCEFTYMRIIEAMAEGGETSHAGRTTAYVTAAVIGLPLIYMLSVGPAIVMAHRFPGLTPELEVI